MEEYATEAKQYGVYVYVAGEADVQSCANIYSRIEVLVETGGPFGVTYCGLKLVVTGPWDSRDSTSAAAGKPSE